MVLGHPVDEDFTACPPRTFNPIGLSLSVVIPVTRMHQESSTPSMQKVTRHFMKSATRSPMKQDHRRSVFRISVSFVGKRKQLEQPRTW